MVKVLPNPEQCEGLCPSCGSPSLEVVVVVDSRPEHLPMLLGRVVRCASCDVTLDCCPPS